MYLSYWSLLVLHYTIHSNTMKHYYCSVFFAIKAILAIAVATVVSLQLAILPSMVLPAAIVDPKIIQQRETSSFVTRQRYSPHRGTRVESSAITTITVKMNHMEQSFPKNMTVFSSSSSSSSSSRSLNRLPTWMQQYIHWHSETRRTKLLTREFWRNNPNQRPMLFILQCMEMDIRCGGTADRLKPIPLMILAAAQNKRLFFIRWKDRPCRLEEFFQPPPHTLLDWTIPDWLEEELGNYETIRRRHIVNVFHVLPGTKTATDNGIPLVTCHIQWPNGGETVYDNHVGVPGEFQRIHHDLFFYLFQPTPPIQQRLDTIYASTPLGGPNQYVAAHYRAYWWEQFDPPSEQEQIDNAINAVNCASTLRSHTPIYFASDSHVARQTIQSWWTNRHHHQHHQPTTAANSRPSRRPLVVIHHSNLYHLDRVTTTMNLPSQLSTTTPTTINNHSNSIWYPNATLTYVPVEDLYPIFVDLLVLANAKCIAQGDGGFGKYALLLSTDPTCTRKHHFKHERQVCTWKD